MIAMAWLYFYDLVFIIHYDDYCAIEDEYDSSF